MNPAKITCIEDLRQIYESRVPRMFYDYCDTGSYTTGTYVDNTRAFDKYKLRQRVARNIDNRSLKTRMVGQDVSMPVALAPIGLVVHLISDLMYTWIDPRIDFEARET